MAPYFIMRDFAKTFYKSKAWQNCRQTYLQKQKGLCEECLRHGLYTPADTVHHIVHITPENIDDPSITLNYDNLEAVCRDCHAMLHTKKKRYKVDDMGRVVVIV